LSIDLRKGGFARVCVLHNFIWYNMLMCLFSIRGHKGLGFCQVRTEVILIVCLYLFLLIYIKKQKNEKIDFSLLLHFPSVPS
jgi:hypothetical protein